MTHIHKKSGLEFEVGQVVDQKDGKTYDINVIFQFPDYDNDDNDLEVKFSNFYFGDYDPEVTDDYIDLYLEEHQEQS